MLEKYGDQYKTAEQKAIELNAQIEAQKLALQNDPNSIENQLKYMKLAQAQEELNQLATYGPQEAAAKIKQIESQIAQNNASASASANASNALATQRLNNPNGTSTTGLKYKDYYDDGMAMKNAGNYDSTSGTWNRRYTDEDIYNWVDKLSIDDEYKEQLISDLGLQQIQVIKSNKQGNHY